MLDIVPDEEFLLEVDSNSNQASLFCPYRKDFSILLKIVVQVLFGRFTVATLSDFRNEPPYDVYFGIVPIG